MLLSGKLNPATVIVPLEVVVGVPVPPHAATRSTAPSAAASGPKLSFQFIESPPLEAASLPIQPGLSLDSSIYAVLNAAARWATGALSRRIPRGTSRRSRPERDSSVASASSATRIAPAKVFV